MNWPFRKPAKESNFTRLYEYETGTYSAGHTRPDRQQVRATNAFAAADAAASYNSKFFKLVVVATGERLELYRPDSAAPWELWKSSFEPQKKEPLPTSAPLIFSMANRLGL